MCGHLEWMGKNVVPAHAAFPVCGFPSFPILHYVKPWSELTRGSLVSLTDTGYCLMG